MDCRVKPGNDKLARVNFQQPIPSLRHTSAIGVICTSEKLRQINPTGKITRAQNRNGLTETEIFPSAVCSTLNSTSFCATVSPTFTYISPVQDEAPAFFEFTTMVSSSE